MIMTWKKARKSNRLRLRFSLEKLRDPDVALTFLVGRWMAELTEKDG